LYEAFVEFEPLYTPGGFRATTPTGDNIRARWSEGPVWVALAGDAVVGTVAAVVKGESLYVRSMAVLPSARGQNAGGLLLGAVEAYGAERGCRRLFLCTTPFLTGAIRLYERSGFKRTSEGPSDLQGTPLFSMEKAL
jgi:GNAT superfamily N-acetyltransferase